MTSEHHPDAATVLAHEGGMGTATITYALSALTAAGFAVVKVGEPPPWMLYGNCVDCGCAVATWGLPKNQGDIFVMRDPEPDA